MQTAISFFAIKYDGELFYYDEDTIDFEQHFDEQIKEIQAFDSACLEKGILVYHISEFSLDDSDGTELEIAVADDIRKAKKDLSYLRSIMENGSQYAAVKAAVIDIDDDDWDSE